MFLLFGFLTTLSEQLHAEHRYLENPDMAKAASMTSARNIWNPFTALLCLSFIMADKSIIGYPAEPITGPLSMGIRIKETSFKLTKVNQSIVFAFCKRTKSSLCQTSPLNLTSSRKVCTTSTCNRQ